MIPVSLCWLYWLLDCTGAGLLKMLAELVGCLHLSSLNAGYL
jgi:hypothetical protein